MQCTYVDRVVHFRCRISHAWPTIKGWTAEALTQREQIEISFGKFGSGNLEGCINKEQYLIEEENRRREEVKSGDPVEARRNRTRKIRDEFCAYSANMSKAINEWVDYFKKIPIEVMGEDFVRIGSQLGKKVLGLESEDAPDDEEIQASLTQARFDEVEYDASWISDMEDLMKSYDNIQSLNNQFDHPSFSLGVFPDSQEPGDAQHVWDRLEHSRHDDEAGTSGATNLAADDDEIRMEQQPEE